MDGVRGTRGVEEKYRASMSGVPKEGVQLENLGICGKIMLKKILKKQDGRAWIGWITCCERCDKPRFIKSGDLKY